MFVLPRKTPAGWAWLVMLVGILAYEVKAPAGQLLSEEADRWMERRPWLTRFMVMAVALHLINAVPRRFDVVALIFAPIAWGKARRLTRLTAQPVITVA